MVRSASSLINYRLIILYIDQRGPSVMFRFTLVLTQAAAFSCERTISISRFRVSAAINKYQRLYF